MFEENELISSYSRAQAIEDGVLINVSEVAREAGFTCPVAVTAEVWAKIENIPPALQGSQDVQGRLWDVLWMLRLASNCDASEIYYKLIMDRNEHGHRRRYLTLKATIGPGDNGGPVVTVMLPCQD